MVLTAWEEFWVQSAELVIVQKKRNDETSFNPSFLNRGQAQVALAA